MYERESTEMPIWAIKDEVCGSLVQLQFQYRKSRPSAPDSTLRK
jgi:hypothetical protein